MKTKFRNVIIEDLIELICAETGKSTSKPNYLRNRNLVQTYKKGE